MQRLRPYAVESALAVLLVVAGVLPWLGLVGALPWGADATKWVAHSSLDSPRWLDWAIAQKHFVGYRPVTALAFVVNQAVTGHSAYGYSAFDLTLSVAAGLLLFLLYRALFGDRSGWGLLPVLLLFGHPVIEEVVPYVARRSYLLATVFGLATLLAWLRALDPAGESRARRWAWAFATGLLLGLAVLSNEVAYVLLPLLPLFALDRAGWRALPKVLPAAVVCALAVLVRHQVLGVWGGGYQKRYFAFVKDHVPMWRERLTWEPDAIAAACWSYVLNPVGVDGDDPLFPKVVGTVVTVLLAAWVGWYGVLRPLLRWRTPGARTPLVLVAWLLGSTAIVVLSQTWFWRQAYSLVPPLGLLLAHVVSTGWQALPEQRWRVVPGLAGGWVLLATGLWNGPLWTGANTAVHQTRIDGTRVVHQVRDRLAVIDGPATVWLVVPVRASASHIVRLWADRFGAGRHVSSRVLAHLRPNGDTGTLVLRTADDERPRVSLAGGFIWANVPPFSSLEPGARFDPSRLHRSGKVTTFVLAVDTEGSWLLRVAPPPPGLDLLPEAPVEEPVEEPTEDPLEDPSEEIPFEEEAPE